MISPAVEQVVSIALAKDPKQRFDNVQAFARALEQAGTLTFIPPPIRPMMPTPNMPAPTEAVMRPPQQAQPTQMGTPPTQPSWPKEALPPFNEQRDIPVAATPPFQPVNQVGYPIQPGFEPAQHRTSRRTVIIGLAAVGVAAIAGGGALWLNRPQGTSSPPTHPQGTPTLPQGSSTSQPSGVLRAGVGVDTTNKTITLGILSAYSGPVATPIGIPLASGIKVFFEHVNDSGGIDGFRVKFIEEDTQYDPQIAVQKYQQIHNQILMIADSLGTPHTEAINPLATADHMLVSAATLSSSLSQEKYLILVGTPYRLQVENAFDYVVNKLGMQNPATGIIYQNDEYGQDGLRGYQEAISAYNLHDVGQVSYAATDTDFTSQVTQLKTAGARYVFLTTTPSVTAGIVVKAYQLGYHPQWILQSPAFAQVLFTEAPALKALLNGAWLISQGATWGDTSVPGMAQMLQDIQKYAPNQQPNTYFQFGYTESKITYAILKKALDNNDITRDGLFAAFESLKNVDMGGLLPPVSYGTTPNERVPTRDSVIYSIDPTQPVDVKPITSDFTGTAAMASQF